MRREDLLTSDEAIELFGSTGLRVAEELRCSLEALECVLWGGRTPSGLTEAQRALIQEHRNAVGRVVRAGHGSLIDDQVEGLVSLASFYQEQRRERARLVRQR
jgi:hypothetical protein